MLKSQGKHESVHEQKIAAEPKIVHYVVEHLAVELVDTKHGTPTTTTLEEAHPHKHNAAVSWGQLDQLIALSDDRVLTCIKFAEFPSKGAQVRK